MAIARYTLTPGVTLLAGEELELTHVVGAGPVSYRVVDAEGKEIRCGVIEPQESTDLNNLEQP